MDRPVRSITEKRVDPQCPIRIIIIFFQAEHEAQIYYKQEKWRGII
jgi:hypothetical protein